MVWGSMIAWYLFLAGASAGAFLTSAFVEAKYPDSVKMRVAGRIISPIFLGIGLLMLMLDAEAGLHNPLRFFYLIMNPGSVMTLGVYFICVFMPVSIAAALLEVLRRPVPKWLTWTGIVSAFCVAAYTGFLLGVVSATRCGTTPFCRCCSWCRLCRRVWRLRAWWALSPIVSASSRCGSSRRAT